MSTTKLRSKYSTKLAGNKVTTRLQRVFSRDIGGWSIATFLIGLLILIPLCIVFGGIWEGGPKWDHLATTVLGSYLLNTAILAVTVSILSLGFAVLPAWLVSVFEFPGRRFFEWALVLPLAIPTYVAAIVYFAIPEAAIPLLVKIRLNFGVDAFIWAEKILRYGLLSMVMAGVLFPYLYISVRASFSQQRSAAIEAARTLGRSPASVFFSIAMPLARPAIAAGLTLILMEVINDYGAVNFFGIPTLTEGIFRTWFGLGDRASAMRLAAFAMTAVLAIVMIERALRGNAGFSETAQNSAPLLRTKLLGLRKWLGFLVCAIPLAIGFLIPMVQLLIWAAATFAMVLKPKFIEQMLHSLWLSLLTAAGLALIALVFSYSTKIYPTRCNRCVSRLATLGYAVPGAVIAVGVMIFFAAIDRSIPTKKIYISGTLIAIVFAYIIRFLTVAYEPIKSGMSGICGNLDEASRSLGKSPLYSLIKIDIPLLRGTLIAASMLVFVDILKELPLTMILRPANFETLATTAFGLAKEGQIYQSAVPSLLIVLAGATGLIVLNRFTQKATS